MIENRRGDNFRAKYGDFKGEHNPMFRKNRQDRSELNKLRTGKTLEEIYGIEKARIIKSKLSKASSGENNPNFGKHKQKEQIKGNCKTCGKEIINRTFCNINCYRLWQKHNAGYNFKMKGKTGSANPMFGKKQSELNKQKNREMRLGKTYEEIMGLEKSIKVKKNISLRMKDRTPWNTGETKETNKKLFDMSQTKKEKYLSGELVSWSKNKTTETDDRIKRAGEKVSKTKIEQWSNEEYKTKMLQKMVRLVSKKELLLNSILQENFDNFWIHTGNSKFWLSFNNIHINPDFISFDKTKAIDFLGCYWHKCNLCYNYPITNDLTIRENVYTSRNMKVLYIWEHELKHIDLIIEKIKQFIEI